MLVMPQKSEFHNRLIICPQIVASLPLGQIGERAKPGAGFQNDGQVKGRNGEYATESEVIAKVR